jgi:hypothetical protein
MDILNFISWIKGKRQVTSVDATKTLLPVGLKDPKRDDGYLAGAITVQDFINQVGTGPQGVQGIPGLNGAIGPVGPAGLNWQGAWVSGGSYVVDDAVGFGGASWFCINNTSGTIAPNIDDVNWALLANIGATGPQGPTGTTGAQGIQGVQGIQGPQGIQGIPGVNAPKFASTGIFSTSATTNTLLTSILIPANTFSANDAFNVEVQMTKTAGALAYLSLRVNTAPLVAGSTEIAHVQSGNSNSFLFFGVKRSYFINGGTTYSFSTTLSSTLSDESLSTSPGSNLTIDWTQNQYIIVSGRVQNATISVTCKGIRIY